MKRVVRSGNKVYIGLGSFAELQIGLISHRVNLWVYRPWRHRYTVYYGRPNRVWIPIATAKAERGNRLSEKRRMIEFLYTLLDIFIDFMRWLRRGLFDLKFALIGIFSAWADEIKPRALQRWDKIRNWYVNKRDRDN